MATIHTGSTKITQHTSGNKITPNMIVFDESCKTLDRTKQLLSLILLS